MKYEYLTNVALERARDDYLRFLGDAGMKGKEETLPVAISLDRITAHAVYAKISAPHYIASAMDGIAINSALSFGASETTPVRLKNEDFIRIDTGDPLPGGCDAVVMIEDVVEIENGVLLYAPATPWQHIRQIGEDISAGDMILPSYTQISPSSMGAMLAGGVLNVQLISKPVIGIIPTGDEIVVPTSAPRPGDIMEFNSSIFSGMLKQWGAEPRVYPILHDEPESMYSGIKKAVSECDGLLIIAGTSAGRDDYTTDVLKKLGHILYHGVAIKPGKPAVLARIGSKPVLGVPGYPVSGIIVLEELFKPVIFDLIRKTPDNPQETVAVLSKRVNSSLKYKEYIRMSVSSGSQGLQAVPLKRGAGVISSFVKADAILEIPQNSEGYEAGDKVNVRLLRPMSSIANTLSIIGSHDPLLDEAGDILRRENHSLSVSSAHLGSMGGIMAVMRDEAMLAGVHLLDPETGEYNISYVNRFFPGGGATLMRCVDRVQGLIVAQGNPLSVSGFEDISNLRFVNRQGGSGTRVLCDHLLKKKGLSPTAINGYAREEFTHTAVAAQIAAGTADAGLGIYSAAKLYGLDFIPICNEQYDLLLRSKNLDHPLMCRFVQILQGEKFERRLDALGGYVLREPGALIKL